ncbi:MAG: hypothetical protein ABL921_31275 [Pirellula sp.]
MQLTFHLGEPEVIALSEPFYKNSPTLQLAKNITRWLLPFFFVAGSVGRSEFRWDSTDKTVLTDDYLIVFFAGAQGFAISIAEVGLEQAKTAFDRMNTLIVEAKSLPSVRA